jgi:hypothetical protein
MKTVDLVPTWTAALQIVTTLFQDSRNHVRGAKNQALMDERIALMNEVFAPLCTQADKRIAEARAEAEAKEPTVCQACADTLPCGHATVDEEARCTLCGGEGP